MSLILPLSQITARSGTDSASRTDDPAAVGAPFRQELIQALGRKLTEGELPVAPVSTGLPPQEGTAERLDPLGAALRALLGGEPRTETIEGAEPVTEKGEPTEPELGERSVPTTGTEVAAGLVMVVTESSQAPVPPATSEPAPVQVEVRAETVPIPNGAPVLPLVQLAPEPVPQAEPVPLPSVAQAVSMVEAAAESIQIEPPTEPESEPIVDRPNAGAGKVATAKAPTFSDLVELITATQARDDVRRLPGEAAPVLKLIPEPTAETVAEGQSVSRADGQPDPFPLVENHLSGPKPIFGEPLPAPVESGPARAIPIPTPALLNQVTRSIRLLAEGARSELHVKLHPAELGEVLVRLTIQDGVVQAHLQTSDAAVKATLDANLDALKVRFEQQGLQVSSLAVSTGAGQLTDDGQARSGWAQESSKHSSQSNGDDPDGDKSTAETPPNLARRILGRRWGSRLDSFA